MVRHEILQGKSCFLTGCGGTGKSYLTARLITDLKEKYGPAAVAVTATTGIAACHIRGVSLHSFAGIGLGQESADLLIKRVRRSRWAADRWRATRCLVIDEISMLDAALFDKLDAIARSLRADPRPFGGLQLLLVGDFAQLPPVSKGGAPPADFCFDARAWTAAVEVQVELRQVFRQRDAAFVALLAAIRLGECTPATVARLAAASAAAAAAADAAVAGGGAPAERPTRLFARNAEVEDVNARGVAALPGPAVTLAAHDTGQSPHLEALQKSCLAPATLVLKIGAQASPPPAAPRRAAPAAPR
jgi:ATP-dependent DNA helicase PIF1